MFAMLMLAASPVSQGPVPVDQSQPPVLRHGRAIATYEDYPQDANRRNEYGVVSVLLHVSIDGKVTTCDVTESASSTSLDTITCALLKSRARFDPAKSAAGVPIAGEYRIALSWGVGEHQPSTKMALPLEVNDIPQGYRSPVQAQLMFDATGRVSSCEVTTTSGSSAADQATCAYAKQNLTINAPKSGSRGVLAVAMRYLTASLATAKTKPLR